MAAIVIGIRGLVVPGEVLMMLLEGCSALVLIVLGKPLFGAGFVADAAGSAAEGHVAVPFHPASLHAPPVLEGVMNVTPVHVHDVGVVVEIAPAPLAACKADSAIAEAIINAAVIADVTAPVAFMEKIPATFKAPVAGRP
jgi:hypothetical protein